MTCPARTVHQVETIGTDAGDDLIVLTAAALDGDRAAWEKLVDRLSGAVWGSISRFSLSPEDRKDAFAATFFRLYERLSTVREPEKLHGWIATTARNEVHAILRARRRLVPVELIDDQLPPERAVAEDAVLDAELHEAAAAAFRRLPEGCQRLLRLLIEEPPLAYAEISARLQMKVGSIGPTRQRCLNRLRMMPELLAFQNEAVL